MESLIITSLGSSIIIAVVGWANYMTGDFLPWQLCVPAFVISLGLFFWFSYVYDRNLKIAKNKQIIVELLAEEKQKKTKRNNKKVVKFYLPLIRQALEQTEVSNED